MIVIYTDGSGAHSNGLGSASFIVVRDDCVTHFSAFPVCKSMANKVGSDAVTNNFCEYISVIRALDFAVKNGHTDIQIFTDSQLVVKQYNREYQVKNSALYELLAEINATVVQYNLKLTISWVPRTNKYIQEADRYGRQCIKLGRAIE